jgi:hypothetical protein
MLTAAVLAFVVSVAVASGGFSFVAKWGSSGSGNGQFNSPHGVAVDASGDVYVSDLLNARVEKFDSSGNFLTEWGSAGSGDGQFDLPLGLAVDPSGDVYVADVLNDRIEEFDSNGGFLRKWGSSGSGDGQFNHPFGVAVDGSGNVYVTDQQNNRVEKFDSTGVFLAKWGSAGSGDGQFALPIGIAVDQSGSVYVADNNNHRVEKFDSNGTFLTQWGTFGTGNGQFEYPWLLTVDSAGNVYVPDSSNGRVEQFTGGGVFLTSIGSPGSGDGQLSDPLGAAVDSSGNLYGADTNNNRIQKFAPLADSTPPVVACNPPAANVWHPNDVTVSCTAVDDGSGLANAADASFSLTTTVPAATETGSAATNSHQVCDNVNNCATAGPYTFMVDKKGPTVTCAATPAYKLGQTGATVSASVTDGGSGAAASPVMVPVSASTVGSQNAPVTGSDNVGNQTTANCPYTVNYTFSGWLGPVNSPPTVNTGRAGRTYPIQWQLRDAGGTFITTLAAVTNITYKSTTCGSFTGDPTDALETSSTGGTSLRYDSATNQYIYNWKTPSAGCYTLFVSLASGQVLSAFFNLS